MYTNSNISASRSGNVQHPPGPSGTGTASASTASTESKKTAPDERFAFSGKSGGATGGSSVFSVVRGAASAVQNLFVPQKTLDQKKEVQKRVITMLKEAMTGRAGQAWPLGNGDTLLFLANGSGAAIRTPGQAHAAPPGLCVRLDAGRAVVETHGKPEPLHSDAARAIVEQVEAALGQVMRIDQLNLTQLIHQIRDGDPQDAAHVRTALAHRLGLGGKLPAIEPPQVLEKLRGSDWFEAVASEALDLASSLGAIGHVSGLDEKRRLMGAIEAAIEVRRAKDPAFSAHMDHLLSAAPAALPDAAQARPSLTPSLTPAQTAVVQALASSPWARDLFKGATASTPPGAITQMLEQRLHSDDIRQQIRGVDQRREFVPALIRHMFKTGAIDGRQAPLAEAVAQRFAEFERLRYGDDESAGAGASSGRRAPRQMGYPLIEAALDPAAFDAILDDPIRWPKLFNTRMTTMSEGVPSQGFFDNAQAEMVRVAQQLGDSGFLDQALVARVLELAPRIVEAARRDVHHTHGVRYTGPGVEMAQSMFGTVPDQIVREDSAGASSQPPTRPQPKLKLD